MQLIKISSLNILFLAFVFSCLITISNASQYCDYEQPLSMMTAFDPVSMSNLGCSYNIFKGNPFESSDVYKRIFVLKFEYPSKVTNDIQQNKSADHKWVLPDGVSYNSLSSCFSHSNAEYIDSMDKLNTILKNRVIVEEGYPKGSFSLSQQYQKIQKGLSEQSQILVYSESDCVVGEFRVKDTLSTHPLIEDKFVDVLKQLEATQNDSNKFYKFFDIHGTHVITKIKKGSTVRYEFEFNKNDMLEFLNAGLSIEEGAATYLNDNYFKRTLTSLTSEQFLEKERVAISKTGVLTIPSPLRQAHDVDWEQQTIKSPGKNLQVSLITFDRLLSKFTKRDSKGLTTIQIDNLRAGFKQYLSTYCSEWLLPNKRVSSCETSQASIPEFQKKKQNLIERASFSKMPLVFKSNNLYFKVEKQNQKDILISKLQPPSKLQLKEYAFQLNKLDKSSYLLRSLSSNNQCVTLDNCLTQDKSINLILLPCEYQNLCQRFLIEADINNSEYKIKNEFNERGLTIVEDNKPLVVSKDKISIIKVEESKLFS